MRAVNAAMQAQRQKREGLLEIPMVWIGARNRETAEIEGIGLWRGEDVETVTVPDFDTGVMVARTFYNGGMLEIGEVRHEAGLNIRPVSVRLSSISPAVVNAFRAYDANGATVHAWKRGYDPTTRSVLGVEPWFAGYVNRSPIERPAPGGVASVEVEVVSTARLLTITSGLKKSHAAQQRRMGDMIRQYKTIAGRLDISWGSD